MSVQIWKNAKVYYGGYEISADFNKIGLTINTEALDRTTFNATTRQRISGLTDASVDHSGLWQAGEAPLLIDDILSAKHASADEVMTIVPSTGAAGDIAYSLQLLESSYNPMGQHGQLIGFNVSGQSSGGLFRGLLSEVGSKGSTGNGTARQLGAVAAGKRLYAAAHVLSISGGATPTITFVVESDDAVGFASPTTRITMDAMDEIGAQWGSAAGAIADTYFRFKWTVTGTTPSFGVALAFGIF